MVIEMDYWDLGRLTGERLQKFLSFAKNAPRDPSCGCIIWSELAKKFRDEIFAEQDVADKNGEGKNGDVNQ